MRTWSGIDPRQLVEDLRGVVLAAVVDDDDFEVVGQRRRDLDGVITRLAIVPPSLYAGKNTLSPGIGGHFTAILPSGAT